MIKKDRKTILKIVIASTVLPAIFLVSMLLGACGKIQGKNELLNFKNATASVVLSEDGELIGKFFSQNRTNISYDQIPPHLINALIATEDARFFQHKGIDSRASSGFCLNLCFLTTAVPGEEVPSPSSWQKTCLAGKIMVR